MVGKASRDCIVFGKTPAISRTNALGQRCDMALVCRQIADQRFANHLDIGSMRGSGQLMMR